MDVDGLLDQVDPQDFDEWVAWSRVESDPVKRLIEVMKLGFSALCAAQGLDLKPDHFDPEAQKDAADGQEMSPEQAAAMARAAVPGMTSG